MSNPNEKPDHPEPSTTGRTSLVMGGSIAGLWAARVLADHFDRVIIVERDDLPEGPEHRAGVPHARQYHILLLRGLQIMRELFPGLEEELVAAGAVPFDLVGDTKVRVRGQWLPQFPSDQPMLSLSRLLLESAMRRRLRQHPRVRFVEGARITGLLTGEQATAVTGVSIARQPDGEPSTDSLRADLVVDALGRRSPTPEWLQALGYDTPQESVVNSFLGYVSRRYRKPPDWEAGWRMMLLTATAPHDPRGGLIFPEENGTWVVMMAGANKDYPPTDEAGFQAYARSLGPEFYEAVQAAEPSSKIYGYRGTESRWRHYEKLARWPERYVVLGDAFCGFNPVYGQGMTIAALSAVALGRELQAANGRLDGVARRAQKAIGKATEGAWLLATGADLEWPETVGGQNGQSLSDRFGHWYLGKLMQALPYDRTVRLAFTEVNQLVKPATALFAPGVMLRVFRHQLGARPELAGAQTGAAAGQPAAIAGSR